MHLQDDPLAKAVNKFLTLRLANLPPAAQCGIAVLIVTIGAIPRFTFPLDEAPYLSFMPMMFIAGLLLRREVAWFAVALSAITSLLITLGHQGFRPPGFSDWAGFFLFLFLYLFLVVVCDLMRRLFEARVEDLELVKHSEQQQRLLNYELGHRLKNTLAMIQVIGAQTFRRADSLDQAWNLFEARLIALGKAQDVLTETSWESADLKTVIDNALNPHRDDKTRISIAGPDCYISSRCTLAITLALHELATNAGKYGALSSDSGRVSIRWSIESYEGLPQLLFIWEERGGPPVIEPSRKGFGSVMIERSLLSYFNGHGGIEYHPQGVVFKLIAPATMSPEAFKAGTVDILALD